MNIKSFLIIFGCLFLVACSSNPSSSNEKETRSNNNDAGELSTDNLEKVYFAGGCFWGVEAYFEQIPGVYETSTGYANGTGTNPTYMDVIQGDEGFAETVEVIYDADKVGLNELLAYFFAVIDPTVQDQQGNDVGVQYRTGIYYVKEEEKALIQEAFLQEQENYEKPIVTEVLPLDNFYLAEEEHQDYLAKNPNGYCHIDLNILDDLDVDENVYEK